MAETSNTPNGIPSGARGGNRPRIESNRIESDGVQILRADRESPVEKKKEEEKFVFPFFQKEEKTFLEQARNSRKRADRIRNVESERNVKRFHFLSETIFPGTRSNLRVCINLAAVSR